MKARQLRVDTGTVRGRLITAQYVVATDANGPLLAMSRPIGLLPGQRVTVALLDVGRTSGPSLVWVVVDAEPVDVKSAAA